MRRVQYDSRPTLARPGHFVALAFTDLHLAGRTAGLLFWSNLRAKYRRALLSYAWVVLPPIVTALVFLLLRNHGLAVFGNTRMPYFLFVLIGMTLWMAFVDALHMPLRDLQASRRFLARSAVPHETILLAGLYDVLANAVLRIALGMLVAVAMGQAISPWAIVLLPVGGLALAVLGMAIGLLVAPAGLLFADVGRGLSLVSGLWFFLTPVVYAANGTRWLALNPVSPLLTTSRAALAGPVDVMPLLLMGGGSCLGLIVAWLLYRLAQPHFQALLT